MSLTFWGFNPTEAGLEPEGAQWIKEEGYISTDKFDSELIDNLYRNNPDTRQFWPIFDITLTNSQGALVNDYGY